jgi:hypothetical protein
LGKLRDEVKRLRMQTNDTQFLRTELRRLRGQLSIARSEITSNAPPDVPAEDIHPRDSWKFAGFDTPDNAIESATFAISQGDEAGYLDSLAPDLRDEMEAELSDGMFGDVGPLELSEAGGYRVLDREVLSEDAQIITVYMDGDASETPMMLVRTADGWKVAGAANVEQ